MEVYSKEWLNKNISINDIRDYKNGTCSDSVRKIIEEEKKRNEPVMLVYKNFCFQLNNSVDRYEKLTAFINHICKDKNEALYEKLLGDKRIFIDNMDGIKDECALSDDDIKKFNILSKDEVKEIISNKLPKCDADFLTNYIYWSFSYNMSEKNAKEVFNKLYDIYLLQYDLNKANKSDINYLLMYNEKSNNYRKILKYFDTNNLNCLYPSLDNYSFDFKYDKLLNQIERIKNEKQAGRFFRNIYDAKDMVLGDVEVDEVDVVEPDNNKYEVRDIVNITREYLMEIDPSGRRIEYFDKMYDAGLIIFYDDESKDMYSKHIHDCKNINFYSSKTKDDKPSIFINFDSKIEDVCTLVHEFEHAYGQAFYGIKDRNLCEFPSIYFERNCQTYLRKKGYNVNGFNRYADVLSSKPYAELLYIMLDDNLKDKREVVKNYIYCENGKYFGYDKYIDELNYRALNPHNLFINNVYIIGYNLCRRAENNNISSDDMLYLFDNLGVLDLRNVDDYVSSQKGKTIK